MLRYFVSTAVFVAPRRGVGFGESRRPAVASVCKAKRVWEIGVFWLLLKTRLKSITPSAHPCQTSHHRQRTQEGGGEEEKEGETEGRNARLTIVRSETIDKGPRVGFLSRGKKRTAFLMHVCSSSSCPRNLELQARLPLSSSRTSDEGRFPLMAASWITEMAPAIPGCSLAIPCITITASMRLPMP